ncbi:MAG: bifunctional 4-hydroxy-2-oxoglutarate aldolase/2-dehydro-3-deoxy-phosphogluconate aldolase [Christensenellales bacterium]|jgi:2-dehydro-3-deoxyphosphogluconate aldolase/(4S)-4-hydroxy-2-oxoglutarate aldolase
MSKVLEKLSLAGIIPVIKIEDANDAVPLCKALQNGGLPVAEITFRTGAAEQAIRNINKELPNILLGAGTVLSVEQVDRAVAAGAKYIVSPGLNPKTVKHCQKLNVPIVAGCANPSDLELAIELGLETVKFFPAEALGGIKTIKAISAPFPQIRFIPTGGINDKNLLEYLNFDRVVACGGSWMVPSNLIANKDWNRIEELTSAAVNLMLGLELCHIGINSGTQEQAYQDAQTLANLMDISIIEHEKSFTIGKSFELMKTKGRGEKGNLAIFCNDVNRAVWHLAQKGFTFDETTRVVKGSKTISIYLKQEVADFAIYLLRK